MKIIESPQNGFCPGVKNAVELVEKHASSNTYCLGEISHNEDVINRLKGLGVKFVDSIDDIPDNLQISENPENPPQEPLKIIIRAHGVGKAIYDKLSKKNAQIIDATCPSVHRIHKIVGEQNSNNRRIIIIGDPSHPEVEGIKGWCDNPIIINDENFDASALKNLENVCVVSQTTFSATKYLQIIEKIKKSVQKTLEIFDTICYTTLTNQRLAEEIAQKCDTVLVVGSKKSSNTVKLLESAARHCKAYLISSLAELKNLKISPAATIGLLAGASTPKESIMEVKEYMSKNAEEVLVSDELKAGIEETLMNYREGKKVKGTVISADASGIRVNIGGKYDGIVYPNEAEIEKNFDPAGYPAGREIEAVIMGKKDSDTDCIPLSKRKIDLIKEGDKVIESIRGGQPFEVLCTSVSKGGLLGKLGTYTVFVPSSQIKERGYPKDLNVYLKKKMRLTALEIDDTKKKIICSQKKILAAEREEREGVFWTHVVPNVIVNGTVKRATDFGAFVSVDNFDCLAHIVDLSWNHIKSVDEVLKIGESYDFIVLSADKEKGRVSLGYKQLQSHPFTTSMQKHPVGSICKGRVVSIVPFGAFVQIEPGIEGLVHVSEASNGYIKNINEAVKVGEEVDVMILAVDDAARKITLSIKACLPEEAPIEEPVEDKRGFDRDKGGKGGRDRKPRNPDEQNEWSEENKNNPFAQLLKDMDVK